MKHFVQDIVGELGQIVTDQLAYLDDQVINLSEEDLNWRPFKHKWTILEVIEHLNRFGVFYLPKIQDVVENPKSNEVSDIYKSSFFGEFAFRRVRPVNGVVKNKAKSLSKNNPFLRQLDRSVIFEHMDMQKKALHLLGEASQINMSKNSLPTMIGNWFKLNLGDSLRMMIYHQERHYIQIDDLVKKKPV